MAQRLKNVQLLVLLDTIAPAHLESPGEATVSEAEVPTGLAETTARRLRAVFSANRTAVRAYRPEPYPGKVLLVRAARRLDDPTLGWKSLASDLVAEALDADHYSLLQEPAVESLAQLLSPIPPPATLS